MNGACLNLLNHLFSDTATILKKKKRTLAIKLRCIHYKNEANIFFSDVKINFQNNCYSITVCYQKKAMHKKCPHNIKL